MNVLQKYESEKNSKFDKKIFLQSAKIDEKITKQVLTFEGIFLKPDCLLYKNENNQYCIGMKCFNCKQMHPRNALFFSRNELLESFEAAKPGHEEFHNTSTFPCRLCGPSRTEISFLKNWKQHKLLSISQLKMKISDQKHIGKISGFPIEFKAGKISIGFYNTPPGKTSSRGSSNSFTYENLFFDLKCFIPAKAGKYLGCVEDVYDEMSRLEIDLNRPNVEIFKSMHFTKKQSGVTANRTTDSKLYAKETNYYHLPAIISTMISRCIFNDLTTGRISANNLAKTSLEVRKKIQKKVIDYIISINGKCELIGYDLTVINGPYRFALNRLDKSKAHFLGDYCLDLSNIRVICRSFNTQIVQTVAQHQTCLNYRRSLPRDGNGKAIY
jgi:hypothetical protein